ncbi:MAG TPA: histidine kinase dimerization/phosphoacceptor domain-containing protein [Solirubrobacteraceae bacterium]|jgi:signal transduction histidine kinase|nr:histidine kinase dimerization/phosphoacceptor domain-containing protein [Solirubrobacteraceae bacterium]
MLLRRLGYGNVALAAVGAVALIVEGMVRAKGGLSPGDYLLALATAAPLAWRTRAPLTALIAVEIGAVLCVALFEAGVVATGLVVIQLFTVALLGDRQRSVAVGALTAIGVILAIVLISGSLDLGAVGSRVPLVFASLALGDTLRSRQALHGAAHERAQREAHEREEEGRRRVADERLRIARELHDTLAHSLVAINVRAGVAVDLDDAEDRSGALRDIKHVSATALRDLRATLSLLRDQDDAAPTAPAFALEALPGLVDRVRSAGLAADV